MLTSQTNLTNSNKNQFYSNGFKLWKAGLNRITCKTFRVSVAIQIVKHNDPLKKKQQKESGLPFTDPLLALAVCITGHENIITVSEIDN